MINCILFSDKLNFTLEIETLTLILKKYVNYTKFIKIINKLYKNLNKYIIIIIILL